MSKQKNHSPEFKAKVALAGFLGPTGMAGGWTSLGNCQDSGERASVGLIDMPLQPAPGTMATVGALADLGAELPYPAVDRGGIDRHPALGQQIADVAT